MSGTDDPRLQRELAVLELDAAETTRILTGFIREELGRFGFRRAVLGLSGGLDSATTAALAARALGPRNVVAVLMPYRTSSPDSVADARRVVDSLGIGMEQVDISPMVDGFTAQVGDVGSRRLGNVMARARMIVLFDRSEEHRALVLGTSNKTELLLGYGTLYGDLACAVNPLGDLYKTQVQRLARYLGVPDPILAKPPSADLWPDQTDEGELGYAYAELDPLLSLLVDARVRPETAVSLGFPEAMVRHVTTLIVRNQYKRVTPPIAKVSTRSIGWDFRYPRDWRS